MKDMQEYLQKVRTLTVITSYSIHYTKLYEPQFVHVLVDGRIARSGGPELAEELESTGYEAIEAALATA